MQDLDEIRNNQQLEREIEHELRLKREKKRKHIVTVACIGVVCLIPAFLFFGLKIEKAVKKQMMEQQMTPNIKSAPQGGIQIPQEVFEAKSREDEELKSTPSDIKGMSKYDKLKAGLVIVDNSDTDCDGLTDQEEIEVYGSNPLLCSTAGDLYSDGYKVENGMDLTKKYDYDGTTTATDETGVVTLFAKTPYDLGNASPSPKSPYNAKPLTTGMKAHDYTETAKSIAESDEPETFHVHYCLSETFYKAYSISGYDGDIIQVNLGKIAENLEIDADDLDIEIYAKQPGYEFDIDKKKEMCEIHITGESTQGSPFNAYVVYIIPKEKTNIFSLNALPSTSKTKGTVKSAYNSNHGMILICPPSTCFLNNPPRIYCSTDATEEEKAILLAQATKVYRGVFYKPIWVERPTCTEDYITYTSTETIQGIYKICEMFLGRKNKMDIRGEADLPDRIALLMYQNLGDFYDDAKAEGEKRAKKRAERTAAFSLMDEFNFSNFDSIYSNSGVCMGFARVAAEVFNDGCIQEPRSMRDDVLNYDMLSPEGANGISYDLTETNGCETFFDRFLNDYDTGLNPLDEDEDQVIRMLTYYWNVGNVLMYSQNDWSSFFIDKNRGEYVSWKTIENAVANMADHKALICGLSIGNRDDGAHAINLVGYTRYGSTTLVRDGYELDVEDFVAFDTYDSNNPQSIGTLNCYKVNLTDEDSIVLYEYNTSAGYEVSNAYRSQFMGLDTDRISPDAEQMIMFCILTDDLKSLNVKQWY